MPCTAPEAKTGAGYVYVLTNPSFPTFVKIGYADDVAVIMALFPDYYGEVRRTLQENGFRHIMTFEELEWLYYRRAKLRGGAEDRNNREDR